MSKYSVQAFMDNLPEPILENEHLRQLAEVAARVMLKVYGQRWKAAIYSKIDDLDEAVLDILAVDLKIDWYDYNASIEVKRRLVRDSWYVHRRMGSRTAVETALSDVWPYSVVEEWFEYGGDPYHFRVVLDADHSEPIHVDAAMDKLRIFKPARAALDDNEPTIRVATHLVVNTGRYSQKYHVIPSGIRPTRAVHGDKGTMNIIVKSSKLSQKYKVDPSGTTIAGTKPTRATHGEVDGGSLTLDSRGLSNSYRVRPCGTPLHSLM